jgi:hypothetical protein
MIAADCYVFNNYRYLNYTYNIHYLFLVPKSETNKVKGSGWFSDWMKSAYSNYQAAQVMAADDCPPPEPPDSTL